MPVAETDIPGLLVVHWDANTDERGFFKQTYQARELHRALGRPVALLQGNHSRSLPGVLRGFHAEPWDKLVYVARGRVMAAVADLRPGEETFGEARTFSMGDDGDERVALFVSRGLANAFCVHGDDPVDYLYHVTEYWHPDVEKMSVRWDDPDLGVAWPLVQPILSPADQRNPSLRNLFPDHPRWG